MATRPPKPLAMHCIQACATCWKAHFKRNKKTFNKEFYFTTYGGREQALVMAQAWRDEMIRLHPMVQRKDKAQQIKRNNTSGVAGVVGQKGRNGQLARWTARTLVEPGKWLLKSFSLSRYGEQAKALAIAERERQLEQMKGRVTRHPLDQVDEHTPPPEQTWVPPPLLKPEVLTARNKTGISGVQCELWPDGRPRYWRASTPLRENQTLFKTFSVWRYGEEARSLAIAERQIQRQFKADLVMGRKTLKEVVEEYRRDRGLTKSLKLTGQAAAGVSQRVQRWSKEP